MKNSFFSYFIKPSAKTAPKEKTTAQLYYEAVDSGDIVRASEFLRAIQTKQLPEPE